MVSIDPAEARGPAPTAASTKLYHAAWRWHFYAGLYVIPFLVMLAVTSLVMLWTAVLAGRDGERIPVVPRGEPMAVSAQAEAAAAAVPGGEVVHHVAPRAPDLAALVRVDVGDAPVMVALDPYTGAVLAEAPRRSGVYDLANDIHGTLLIGTTGDRLIEVAASLAMVLIATGLYLWWPRGAGWRALVPDLSARGRGLWRSLHAVLGAWISGLLAVFLVSGLAWAGVWGGKLVQPWSTFPAEKWDAPLSDVTHASMNTGAAEEVPWALEQAPMPASGSRAGAPGLPEGAPVTADAVAAFARAEGFEGRFQLAWPQGETGVWTISRDSMSNDGPDPTSDRTVHLDRHTGRVLADVRFEDYSAGGKAMAVGIAFHEGDMGAWNVALNTVFCLPVIFVSVSGAVMWWMRRPRGSGRLAAPPMPRELPMWQGAALVGLALSMAFPLAGVAILTVLALDTLVLSRLPALRRRLT